MSQIQKYQIASAFAQSSLAFGLESARILRMASLPADFTGVGARSVTAAEYYALWSAVDTVAAVPDLPYQMADAVLERGFDSSLYSFFSSPTVRVALERKALLKPLIAPIDMQICAQEDRVSVRFGSVLSPCGLPSLLGWFNIAYLMQCLQSATGVAINPMWIETPDRRDWGPKVANQFTCDIRNGAAHAFVLSAVDADLPLVSRNDPLWKDLEKGLHNQFTSQMIPHSTAARVRQVLIEGLPGGQVNLDQISDAMAMSKRSLQRRLRDEGVTFKDILEDTRRALATNYLKNTDMSSQEIAFLLGFQDPTSFFRAFRVWTGTSPRAVRKLAV